MRKFIDIVSVDLETVDSDLLEGKKKKKKSRKRHSTFFGYVYGAPSCAADSTDGNGDGGGE